MKERRERILVEFQKVVLFLVEEERRLLQALKKEEEETVARLQVSKASLDQQSHSLHLLLLQLEDKSQEEPLQMLQVRPTDVAAGEGNIECPQNCAPATQYNTPV